MRTLNFCILAPMVCHSPRHSPFSRWMTEAVNASKGLSKKCILQTSRTLYRNKRRSTRHSKSWVKAFASFQECSTQCDKRDQKAEPVDLPPPEKFADAHQLYPA